MRRINKLKRAVSDAAQKRHFGIYERYLVQRASDDKWDTSGGARALSLLQMRYQREI